MDRMTTDQHTKPDSGIKRSMMVVLPVIVAILIAQGCVLPFEKILLFMLLAVAMWWLIFKHKRYEPTGITKIHFYVIIILTGLWAVAFAVLAGKVHDRRIIGG